MDRVATTMVAKGLNFKLREGFSAETSGILLCPCTDLSVIWLVLRHTVVLFVVVLNMSVLQVDWL